MAGFVGSVALLGLGLGLTWEAVAQQPNSAKTAPKGASPASKAAPASPKANAQPQPSAQATPAGSTAPAGNPTPPAPTSFVAIGQLQGAGVKTCLPLMNELLRATVDAEHTAVTTWNKEAPDQRAVSSINVMTLPNDIAPRAIGFVATTPTTSNHCDGEKMRVQPSKLSCDAIAANLAKQNVAQPAVMGDVRVYAPMNQGSRIILLPAATSGCVVIDTGSFYGR